MISVFLIFQTNEIPHESNSCSPDEEQISVSINTSSVESELKGKDLKRNVSSIIRTGVLPLGLALARGIQSIEPGHLRNDRAPTVSDISRDSSLQRSNVAFKLLFSV